jgi:DNA modification methylase|tara:strand:- start:44 stop:718 length:675 start_codon:yes stop_codon:yes gene_type:complete
VIKRKEIIGDCTLYLGDCLEIMPLIDKVDAVVTDPPFGVGNFIQSTGNKRGQAVTWNECVPSQKYFLQINRLSKHRVIWGANYMNCFEGKGALVWIKNQPMPDFSKAEIASVSWGNKVEILNYTWTNFVNTKVTTHPCERPVRLYEWCIEQIPNKPCSILDPFMGSGSSAIACVNLGRKFIGIELNEDYFNIACERIRKAYDQPDLFIEPPKNLQQIDLLLDKK